MKNLSLPVFLFGIAIPSVQPQSAKDVFEWKVGDITVWTLVEVRRAGDSSILIDAKDAIQKYLPRENFASEINAFLVKSAGKYILIDTGFGKGVLDAMRSLAVKPDDISAVLITHAHGDHTGGLLKDGKPLFKNAELFVSEKEWDAVKNNKNIAQNFSAYGKRFHTFEAAPLDAIAKNTAPALDISSVPGVYPLASEGHTPGHTSFVIKSGGGTLIIFGDLLHIEAVQFPRPDISATYDGNPALAAESRKALLKYAAENKIPVAGMHLVYPAIGFVEKDGAGYKFAAK